MDPALDRLRPGGEQPASALLAIRLLIGAVPAVLLGLSILLALRYPIGRAEHERIRGALERKRAGMERTPPKG